MNDKNILNKIRSLVKKEEEEALDSFIQSDFLNLLTKRIVTQSQQKPDDFKMFRKPVFVFPTVFIVIIIGMILFILTPSRSQEKNALNRIKKISLPKFYWPKIFKWITICLDDHV